MAAWQLIVGGALLVVAAVSWWVWFAWQRARLHHQRRLPTAAPPTMDLGAEPPAVVNLLVHSGDPTGDAVPATLLDLAARRWIEILATSPGHVACRVRGQAPVADAALNPYEQQVYEVVTSVAKDGVAPVESLSAAMHPDSAGFWSTFRARVRNDARARNLEGGHFALHAVFAFVPQALLVAALTVLFPPAIIVALPLGIALWLVSIVVAARGSAHLLSDTGRAAAARWLGVRDFIARDDAFASLPPASVAIWDRYLAYGAAMGVAKDATQGLLLAFRTTMSGSDRRHAMEMLHDPAGAIASLPPDLRPAGLSFLSASAAFGPDAGDFVGMARSLRDRAPAVEAELRRADTSPARRIELAGALRSRLDALRTAAPPDLRDDVTTVYGAVTDALGGALQQGVASTEELDSVRTRVEAALQQSGTGPAWSRIVDYLGEHYVVLGTTPHEPA